MICVEYLYYFQKKIEDLQTINGIQVVPYLMRYNDCNIEDETLIDQNSFFRFILYPEEIINNTINYTFLERQLDEILRISRCLYERILPSKELIFQTDPNGNNNFLNLSDIEIQNMKDIYNNILNNQQFDISILTQKISKHAIYYWIFRFTQEITIQNHIDLGYNNYLEQSIIYTSLYEQIYYNLTKSIDELP